MRTRFPKPPRCLLSALLIVALAGVLGAANPALAKEAPADATSVTVRLVFQESSVARSKRYTLGDVARIEAPDPAQQLRLSRLVLGKSPVVGYRMALSQTDILANLERQGLAGPGVASVFPSHMFLEREAQTVEPSDLQEAIRKEILAQIPPQSERIIVDRIQLPQSVVVPAGDLSHQIDLRLPRRTVGNGSFILDLLVDGESQRKLSGSFQVDMEVDAPQTVKTVDRGRPVDMACCRLIRQRLSQLPSRALTSSDMGLTLRAKRNLAVGEFLSWADVGRDMLVQRGQTVRMVLESISGMRISTTGQARGNGGLGDMVEVVNVSSGKTIQGIVAGAQLVKVPF